MSEESERVISEPQDGAMEELPGPRQTTSSRYYSREAVLIMTVAILVVLSIVTAFVSRLYHRKIHGLADQSFAKGEAAFQAGDAKQALIDYRNALVYAPDNSEFQFHLAQALAAVGQGEQAQSYLLTLLAESPGSGEINLALARISAHSGATSDAINYYHRAIYGVWEQNPLATRWRVRREFCAYLLSRGALTQAEPELIALADQVPPTDIARLKITAALLLRATLWNRAFDEYRMVLNDDPHDEEALAGAGTAAFRSGRFAEATYYLEKMPPQKRADPSIASMLDTARQVRGADPYEAGITFRERASRAMDALRQAQSRVRACAQSQNSSQPGNPGSGTDLENLYATSQKMQSQLNESDLVRDPSQTDALMSLVFQMEDAAEQTCGMPSAGPDRILFLITAIHRGGHR